MVPISKLSFLNLISFNGVIIILILLSFWISRLHHILIELKHNIFIIYILLCLFVFAVQLYASGFFNEKFVDRCSMGPTMMFSGYRGTSTYTLLIYLILQRYAIMSPHLHCTIQNFSSCMIMSVEVLHLPLTSNFLFICVFMFCRRVRCYQNHKNHLLIC
jgi:hypothetical protein